MTDENREFYLYLGNADVSNRISTQMMVTMIIFSWSRSRYSWRDFVSSITDFE